MATAGNRQSTQRLIFKQGYLKKIPNSTKFGASFKRADRRWFVFGGLGGVPFLEYYDSEEDQFRNPPINTISLLTCRYITHSQDMRHSNVLHIGLVDRTLCLAAATVEDMQAWERALQKKLHKLGILQGQGDSHIYTDDPVTNTNWQNSRDPQSPLPATPESLMTPLLNSAACMSETRPNLPVHDTDNTNNTELERHTVNSEYESVWSSESLRSPAAADSLYSPYLNPPCSSPPSAVNGEAMLPTMSPPAVPQRKKSRHLSIVAGHGRSAEGQISVREDNQTSADGSPDTAVVMRRPQTQNHRNVSTNSQTRLPSSPENQTRLPSSPENQTSLPSSPENQTRLPSPPENQVNTAVNSQNEPFLVSPKMMEALGLNNEESPIFGWGAPPPEEGAPPPYSASHRASCVPVSMKGLKEAQVEQLQKEISHTGGVRVILSKADCHHTIALVDCFGAVWISGWNQTARPFLYTALHIGDQVVSINSQVVENSAMALKLIKRCTPHDQITFLLRRTPYAKVFAAKRSAEGQSLGVRREGGTAEIVYVEPNGLAASHGLTAKSRTLDGNSFCNWILTEINSRPLNLFFKDNEIEPRLNAVGMDITFMVQPKDFISALKKQFKAMKNYKDFLVQ